MHDNLGSLSFFTYQMSDAFIPKAFEIRFVREMGCLHWNR